MDGIVSVRLLEILGVLYVCGSIVIWLWGVPPSDPEKAFEFYRVVGSVGGSGLVCFLILLLDAFLDVGASPKRILKWLWNPPIPSKE